MTQETINTSCQCGQSTVAFTGPAVLRFICHCSICQKVYNKPYADIVLLKSSQVLKPADLALVFHKHKRPPAVNRGVCPSCKRPMLATMPLAPGFGMAFIPADNIPKGTALPEPSFHTFYNSRVADVDDASPKVGGYWKSQWAVSKGFLAGLLK